jgi:hypothetical protein
MLCQNCPRKDCIKMCSKLNIEIQKEVEREGYSLKHIKRKEIPYQNIELIAIQRAFKLKGINLFRNS